MHSMSKSLLVWTAVFVYRRDELLDIKEPLESNAQDKDNNFNLAQLLPHPKKATNLEVEMKT